MNTPNPSGEPPRKPVLELIKDIHANAAPEPRPAPMVDPLKLSRFVNVSLLVALAMAVVILILAIWDAMTGVLALKILGTVGVIVLALLAFRGINNPE